MCPFAQVTRTRKPCCRRTLHGLITIPRDVLRPDGLVALWRAVHACLYTGVTDGVVPRPANRGQPLSSHGRRASCARRTAAPTPCSARYHAMAEMPLERINASSFSDGPDGCFTPRSQSDTSLGRTLRCKASTA